MTSTKDLSRSYADQIRAAVSQSPMYKSSGYLTEAQRSQKSREQVVDVFKRIHADLQRYTSEGKPLSDSQKAQILTDAGLLLGLKKPETLPLMLKEASNDNFMALATFWAAFFAEIKL